MACTRRTAPSMTIASRLSGSSRSSSFAFSFRGRQGSMRPCLPRNEKAKEEDLLEPESLDAIVILGAVLRVHAIRQGLDQTEQRRVRTYVGGAVGGVVE